MANLDGHVEKSRQRRSRQVAVLTYLRVRSAHQIGWGLAGRTFLNMPKAIEVLTGMAKFAHGKSKYSTVP